VLKDYGMSASMSRRGNCWDNACSETLFGSLKVERLYGQRFLTRRHAKDEALAWLLWYNQFRFHLELHQSDTIRAAEAISLGWCPRNRQQSTKSVNATRHTSNA